MVFRRKQASSPRQQQTAAAIASDDILNNMATPTTPPPITDLEAGGGVVGEATPLQNTDEPPPLADLPEHSLKERAVAAVAGVGFLTSIFSLIFSAPFHPSVWLSGMLGTLLSPYCAFQQHKITQAEALAETNERMDQEVFQLQTENQRLSTQVTEVEASVQKLQELEETLSSLQSIQGASIEELEIQLATSREITAQMKRNLQGEILQNLTTVLLSCDADGDMQMSDGEIDDIIQQLESIHGVQLKEEALKKIVIDQGRSLYAVLELCRNLLSDDVPEEANIFSFIEDKHEGIV